jgi:uncharacterized membrane protein
LIPGIILASLLFPKEIWVWKISVGFVLDYAVLGILILVYSYVNEGDLFFNLNLTMVIIDVIFISFYLYKTKYLIRISKALYHRSKNSISRFLPLIFLATFICAMPIIMNKNNESFTEFYIDYNSSETPYWRQLIKIDEHLSIPYGIINHEQMIDNYKIILTTNNEIIGLKDLGMIIPDQKIYGEIIIPQRKEHKQRYQMELYKGESRVPYRTLYFWITSE